MQSKFSGYQSLVAVLLAFLQFVVVLNLMIIAPLGALIIPALKMSASQFGTVVSAYAFSACVSGLLIAGFADKFDRKKLLLFFYSGFLLGTFWCGIADSYASLLCARVITGLFGGVIGSIVLTIAADLFGASLRGRVMGIIQTAYSASQILGLPAGLYLSSHLSWGTPLIALAALGSVGGLVIYIGMQPMTDHMAARKQARALSHLWETLTSSRHCAAFATTVLLTMGSYLLLPFISAFTVNNLGIGIERLPLIYMITGAITIFAGPILGHLADAVGKIQIFYAGCALTVIAVLVYTHLPPVPLWVVATINTVMFIGMMTRTIPYQALMASVPAQSDRGAFNSVNAAIQQLSAGLASILAGHVVVMNPDGSIDRFFVVAYLVAAFTLIAAYTGWKVHRKSFEQLVPMASARAD